MTDEQIQKLKQLRWFAFDTETDDKDCRVANIVAASFYHPAIGGIYLNVSGNEGVGIPRWKEICRRLFGEEECRGYTVVLFNAVYDIEIVERNAGVPFLPHIADAQCSLWNLFGPDITDRGEARPPSLKRAVGQHLGRSAAAYDSVGELGPDSPDFAEYALADARNTWDLWEWAKPRCEDVGIWGNVLLDCEFQRCVVEMQQTGFALDRPWLQDRFLANLQELQVLEGNLRRKYGDRNLNSRPQLARFLFQELGVKAPDYVPRMKDGFPSTQADYLNCMSGGGRWLSTFRNYKKLYKEQTGFIEPLLGVPEGKRRTASYLSCGMKSSRISSSNMNLMNIPRGDLKKAFIAAPGRCLVVADLSQIELRVNAHITQEPKLIDPIRKGIKVYSVYADLWEMEYHDAKTAILALQYGMGWRKFALMEGLTFREAKRRWQLFHDTFDTLHNYQDRMSYMAPKMEQIDSPVGRYRPVNEHMRGNKWHLRSVALNFGPQTTAGHIIRMAGVMFMRERPNPEWKLANQVHDEWVVECPEQDAKECMALLQRCMQECGDSIGLCVPVTSEAGYGRSWYDAKG